MTGGGEFFGVDAAVLATGATVPQMLADLDITIADATTIALLVTSRPVHHPLRAVLNTPRVSVRPTPDGGLAINSDWTTAHITLGADGRHQVPEAIYRGAARRGIAGSVWQAGARDRLVRNRAETDAGRRRARTRPR